jgi:penicillin-binding protein 1A
MSGSPEDYYYVDEQGNLVNPDRPRDAPAPKGPPDGGLVPVEPPPAAGEEFLDEAIGRDRPAPSAPN